MENPDKSKLRFNIINLLVYIVGIVLIVRLFNFQIVHGEEYRQLSNNRLTREEIVNPTRGNIFDRTGNVLVGNTMGFELQLYKSKVDTQTLNDTILKVINILEKNNDKYTDTFPITLDPIKYTIEGDALSNWKANNKIEENASAQDALYVFRDKYEINSNDVSKIRKIITVRYRIQTESYSSTKPIIIAKNIGRQSMLEVSELNNDLPGVDIITKSIRDYRNRKPCFSYYRIYGENK